MKIYENVHSAVEPLAVEITTDKVYISSKVHQLTLEDNGRVFSYYEYTLTEYTKDEYLNHLTQSNASLQQELLDTQAALCDVYEMLEGGLV